MPATDLVAVDAEACPACDEPVKHIEIYEPALFVHAGYGATRRRVLRFCRDPLCGWWLDAATDETSPRR